MMGDNKGKKQKVDEENSNIIYSEFVTSIDKLHELQDDLEKINEEASDKVLKVEQEYSEIRKPVYDKRNDIIKAIPDFWLIAFLAHPALGRLLNEEDLKIFKFLSSIEVEESKDVKSGYSITFNFNANPYFGNEKLSKTYTFLEDGATKISGTTIKWKEGMCIPNEVASMKKGKKRSRYEESFFNWFSEVTQKDDEDGALEIQDEVADKIKDELWPNPLYYFENDLDEEDFDNDEGKDSDSSEEDEFSE